MADARDAVRLRMRVTARLRISRLVSLTLVERVRAWWRSSGDSWVLNV